MRFPPARRTSLLVPVLVATGLLPAVSPAPILAAQFSATVAENSGCSNLLDSGSDTMLVVASASFNPPSVCCGSGSGWVSAQGGILGGELDAQVVGTSTNFDTGIIGCATATMEVDDVVITGPGSEVTTTVTIDVRGTLLGEEDDGTASSFLRVRLNLSGVAPGGGPVGSGFETLLINHGAGVLPVDTTLTTDPITVSTAFPLDVEVEFHANVTPSAGKLVPSLKQGTASSTADFAGGVTFTRSGPVFSLPGGFTADSPSGDITDNQYGGTVSARGPVRVGRTLAVHPNPFRSGTSLTFSAEAGTPVRVQALDVRGRLVSKIWTGRATGTSQRVSWAARTVPPGVYFVRVVGAGMTSTQKVLRLR